MVMDLINTPIQNNSHSGSLPAGTAFFPRSGALSSE